MRSRLVACLALLVSGCGSADGMATGLRLDSLVFAGAHNAMASAREPGWRNPTQTLTLRDQLAAGVRAFAIDVYPGFDAGSGRVLTDLADLPAWRADLLAPQPPTDAAAAIRRATPSGSRQPRALYLCHGWCELGATRLDTALGWFRQFLERHPDEILLLVIERHAPADELARALEPFVAATAPGRLPTVAELVASSRRIVVAGDGGIPVVRCGQTAIAGSLRELDAFVPAVGPDPNAAAAANDAANLRGPARACGANIIVADFVERGGVIDLARSLTEARAGADAAPG